MTSCKLHLLNNGFKRSFNLWLQGWLNATIVLFVITGLGSVLIPSNVSANTDELKIKAGPRTGSFYPVTTALRTLLHLKRDEDTSISLTIQSSNGAIENMHALLSGEADLAFVDASTIMAAISAKPPFHKYDTVGSLRAITPLWPQIGHFVIRKQDVKAGNLADYRDLLGETVSFGSIASRSYEAAAHTFRGNGIYHDRLFKIPDLNEVETINSFERDLVNAFVLFTPEKDRRIIQALENKNNDAVLLNVSDVQLAKLNDGEIAVWERYVIPADTYNGQSQAVNTIAQKNYLLVRDDFDPTLAKRIIKTIMDNTAFLETLHPPARHIRNQSTNQQYIVPPHAGVQLYFKENPHCHTIFCLFN